VSGSGFPIFLQIGDSVHQLEELMSDVTTQLNLDLSFSRCDCGTRAGGVRPLPSAAFSLPSTSDAPDDMRRHPPAQASAVACSGIGPIAGMDLLMVVVTVCEVGPAVTGLCEVGPAETGLARSASCRSDGRRARVRARKEEGGCALLLSDGREPVDLSHRHVPRAQWLRAPHPALSAGRRGGNLPLFSVSNTSTSLRRSVPGISSEPARTEG